MPNYCLSLVCTAEVAERLVDTLLSTIPEQVFTSTPTSSDGTPHARLGNMEQVMGRSSSVQIQVMTSEAQLDALLQRLRQEYKGTGLCFWASELSVEGVIA